LEEEWTYLEKVFEEKPELVKDAIEMNIVSYSFT